MKPSSQSSFSLRICSRHVVLFSATSLPSPFCYLEEEKKNPSFPFLPTCSISLTRADGPCNRLYPLASLPPPAPTPTPTPTHTHTHPHTHTYTHTHIHTHSLLASPWQSVHRNCFIFYFFFLLGFFFSVFFCFLLFFLFCDLSFVYFLLFILVMFSYLSSAQVG